MSIAYADRPEPEDLHEWTARGFTVAEARRWIGGGFPLDTAERWRAGGVHTPDQALAWRTAGLSPYTVQPLLRAGMTPRDAVRWHELGYPHEEAAERHLAGERPGPRGWLRTLLRSRSPRPSALDGEQRETMRALLGGGVPAATARAYLDAGWTGAVAVSWAETGIDPAGAAVYRAIGFTPAEAAGLAGRGVDALGLMRDWWDAAIPRTEVAAWVVAGFSAADAARAREVGTTAEQAAVLRALRGD
ncbi:hypothetical protein [Nonomuraea harbinensis]|uniref:Helix-turn-helix domain-containing protein n=1 Tax=Nonomuraea harbinensis TaxID=1286938 RepID=A0ABW1BVQ8_9ACTN|nr:hypothetical protein [Nonomuraea harbinensis]